MTIIRSPQLLRRYTAAIIDYGLYGVFFFWLVYTYGVPDNEGGYSLKNDPKGWWVFVAWIVYFPVVESINGQTLGKMIMGLKVVSTSGNKASFGQTLKRHVLDFIDVSFFGLTAVIVIKNTPAHQRIGDLWAKTIVIGSEDAVCQQCKAQLTISADEVVKGEFVCPTCQTTNHITNRIGRKGSTF